MEGRVIPHCFSRIESRPIIQQSHWVCGPSSPQTSISAQMLVNGEETHRYRGDAREGDQWGMNTLLLDIKHPGLTKQNADDGKTCSVKMYWCSTPQFQE